MKTKPSHSHNYDSPSDLQIDAALGTYSRATPAPGLESRIATRVANARRQALRTRTAARRLLWQRLSAGALATAGACAVIVGTLEHSHRPLPPQQVRSPLSSSGGASAAGGQYTPTHAVPASPQIDPHSPRRPAHGRAIVTRNLSRHADGVAVPRSPYPPDQQTDSQDKPQQ